MNPYSSHISKLNKCLLESFIQPQSYQFYLRQKLIWQRRLVVIFTSQILIGIQVMLNSKALNSSGNMKLLTMNSLGKGQVPGRL